MKLSFKDKLYLYIMSSCKSILKVLDYYDIKYVCSQNIIYYKKNASGEMKKDREQNIFGITGSKKKKTYPIFSNEDFGNYGYCVLYTGKIDEDDPTILGIDIDDYSDIPIKDKLIKFGFNWEEYKDYKWITKSAKGGLHIIYKYSESSDLTTTNLRHTFPDGITRGKDCEEKSGIDCRGSGAKLICAGSKSTIGEYEFVNGIPTENDDPVLLKKLMPNMYRSILRKKVYVKDNDKLIKEEKTITRNQKKENIKYIDDPNDYELQLINVMLKKLEMDNEDFTDWSVIGMCLHNEFGGSDKGLQLFKNFSMDNPKYCETYTNNIWKYWSKWNVKEHYPHLNKRIILRKLIHKCNDKNIFNACRKEAKDIIKAEETMSNNSESTEDIFLSELYQEHRKHFEEEIGVFRVDDTFRRLRVNMNGEVKLESLDESKLIKAYKNLPKIPYIVDGKTKYKSFIQNWIQDPNAKTYYGCAFKPNKPKSFTIKIKDKEYLYSNEFHGYIGDRPNTNTPEEKEFMINTFRTQLKMLCENNDTLLSYCLHFLRKMLLYPEQKSMNVMICFISDYTGLGKNSMIDFIFNKIIGSQYCRISDKLDKLFSGFSDFRHNKIAFCYNEGELSQTFNKFNLLKGLITDKDDVYEAKYQGAIESENLLHIFFLSNDLVSLKITETDRRHFVCFGIPIEPEEEFKKQISNWYKCLKNDNFGSVIYDYLTKDNSWVDDDMGNEFYDYGHNIPMTKAKKSIVETFTPVEIQFLKYLIESNFKTMDGKIKQIANPTEIREYYAITGNEDAMDIDFHTQGLCNIHARSYDNIDDMYVEALNKIEEICDNAPILETELPFSSYINKTNVKNMNKKDRCITLTKLYLILLSIDTSYMDHFKDNCNTTNYLKCNRNPNNLNIRLEMGYFVWKMNDWRKKTNSTESKKQLNSILNKFRIDFNRTTTHNLMKISSINGKKYISFNKKDILRRIEEKYVFSED